MTKMCYKNVHVVKTRRQNVTKYVTKCYVLVMIKIYHKKCPYDENSTKCHEYVTKCHVLLLRNSYE